MKERLDTERRKGMAEHSDRRNQWSAVRQKRKRDEEEVSFEGQRWYTAEELDVAAKLALRLEMNGIDINGMEGHQNKKKQGKEEDNRMHPSRKKI